MAIGDNYGNQNNGLFVTNEDVEKRKLDRERAKKLSQETNRRRKALDDRKRQAAEREKRKISLELTKRKQKQTEATERYQRSHFISKSERRPKTTYARGIPSLDNILQQLRSGSTEISYGADSSHYSSANRVTNNNQHNSILEQHKLKTKQEFQNELKKNHSKSQEQMIKANDDYNAVYDSLEENSMIDKRNITSPPVPAFGYTNADLMSGSAHLSEQELSHSLSRLFIRNQQYNRPPTYELPRAYSKQTFTGNRSGQPMKIEDADDEEEIVIKSHPSQKFERQTPIVKQQSRFDLADSLDDVEPDSLSLNHTIATEITFDEDSLHGSTTTDSTATRSETENSQPYHHFQQQNPALYAYNNNNKDTANSKHNEPKTSPSKAEKHDHNITSTESGEAWSDDGYYFKAYRPRTATHQQQRDDRSLSHDRPRPMPQHNNVMLKVSSGRPSSSKLPATEIRVVEPWSAHQQQQAANNPNHRIVPRVSEGIFDKDERSSADASSGLPIRGGGEESSVDKAVVDEKKPKSILKKVSKYCSKPDSRSSGLVNYSAATIVRQQWVNEIGVSGSAMSPKTNVPLNKSGSSLFEGKSVKWNEIQYDDGTSASLLESKPGLVSQPNSNATSTSTSTSSGKSGKGSAKAKGRGKPAGGRKGSNKSKGSASSRKLKPAKESSSDLAMEPHPPPTKKKQLTSSNALHYSIHNNEPTSIPTSSTNLPLRSKIAWKEPDHGVTLDNLKSSGEQSEETLESKRPHVEVVTSERTGNHVTIHIVTSDCNKNNKEEVVNLSKTPTDQEINQLWENVRSCIAKRSGSNNKINRAPVENQRYLNPSARTLGSRTAWSTQPTVQQQASIVSIDGGMLMHENTRGYSQYRVASQRRRGRRFIRPTSAAVSTSDGRTGETQNFYARHQALLQQRRQKQFMPPSYPAEMMAPNFKTYPGVKTSHQLPTPRSAREQPISNSTTAYLLAEALAEQNLSEEQIMQALESIQRKSFEAQKVGKSLNPSALSMEEQRLLASLERLNSRLDEIESTVSTNPNIGPFTNKNMSLPQHDSGHSGGKRLRRNQSATESRFHRARDHRY